MEISEVRVKLVENPSERLQAFCSITLDGDFVIRDLKVIEGTSGAFVAMPSRKLADRCPRCGAKNHLRAKYCNECGAKLNENRAPKDVQGRAKLHADVAHPINAACRERIQNAVIAAYHAEKEAAQSPDYKPKPLDDYDDDFDTLGPDQEPAASTSAAAPPPKPAEGDDDDFGSDYNSLIAELKREATQRRDHRGGGAGLRRDGVKAPGGAERGERKEPSTSPAPRPAPVPEPPPAAPAPTPVQPARSDDDQDSFGAGLI